jgi:hypothetical protein
MVVTHFLLSLWSWQHKNEANIVYRFVVVWSVLDCPCVLTLWHWMFYICNALCVAQNTDHYTVTTAVMQCLFIFQSAADQSSSQYQCPRVKRYNRAIIWVAFTLSAKSFENLWPVTETVYEWINCALILWLLYRRHVITSCPPCVKTENDFIRVMPLEITVPKTTAWCTIVKIYLLLVYTHCNAVIIRLFSPWLQINHIA